MVCKGQVKMVNQNIDEKKYMDKISCEGIDSKALLVCLIQYIPKLILFALAGAVLGSGLNLIIVSVTELRNLEFVAETKYYIDFAEGRYEARDYYNDFTWNDVVSNDEILGRAMPEINKNSGKEQDRAKISEMITADILSDVRYLTITVKDQNEDLVLVVSSALQKALEEFSVIKDEFDSIYKVKDSGIQKEEVHFFTWRAAFLGAMLVAFIALFVKMFKFSIGDVFYTKADIVKYLGIDAYGLLYKKENNADGIHEKMLVACINKALLELDDSDIKTIGLLDVSGSCYESFINEIKNIDRENNFINKFELISENNTTKTKNVIVLIPFGKQCRELASDMIACMQQLNYNVLGAILVDTDKSWAKLYYGHSVKKP